MIYGCKDTKKLLVYQLSRLISILNFSYRKRYPCWWACYTCSIYQQIVRKIPV